MLMSQPRNKKRYGFPAVIVVTILALVGCSAGASTPASSNAATGEPIKVVSMAAVDYNGPTYEDIKVTSQAFAQQLNADGGINGRPLEVIFCDDKGDPTEAAACARDAIEAGAIADVGSFTYNAAAVIPIYNAADTAVLGGCCNLSEAEYTTPNTFQMGNNPALNPGSVARAAQDGCESIGVLELDLAGITETMELLFTNVAKAYGYTGDLKFVKVPLTTQDYTSQVTQAADGTDCIALFLSESNISAMMPSFAQTGGEQTLYGAQGNLNLRSTKGYESLPGVKNAVVTAAYRPLVDPEWDGMRQALKDVNAPDKFDYNSLSALGVWTAYTGFVQIAKAIDGEITPASFLEAASKSTVSTNGMSPTVDFAKTWDAFDGMFERSFQRKVTYITLEGEHLVEGDDIWIDLTSALLGEPQK